MAMRCMDACARVRTPCLLFFVVFVDVVVYEDEVRALLSSSSLSRYHHVAGGTFSNVFKLAISISLRYRYD